MSWRGDRVIVARDEPGDAFDVLQREDDAVGELLGAWKHATDRLKQGDDVEVRARRGADVKLLLQHLAVRESAIDEIDAALRRQDRPGDADGLQGDGVGRRLAIDHLEELTRGRSAMATNNPEVTRAVDDLARIFETEMSDRPRQISALASVLGLPEERNLPSARYVRTHGPTAPSPTPRWHDRVGVLKATRALYDHLRGSPSGGTVPAVDKARERGSRD